MSVLLLGLPEVGLALLAMLLALGVFVLIRAIANSLPSLSLPFGISIRPGDWFSAIVSPVIGWIIHATENAWNFVSHWIYGHAWLVEQLAVNTVAAIGHLGDQIAHIVNTVIPDAIRAVERDLGGAVNSLERTIARDATRAADDLAHDISKVARSIYTSERGIVSELDHAIKSAVSTGVDEAVSEADRAIADLRSYVDAKVSEAVGHVEGDITHAIDGVYDDLARVASGEVADARSIAAVVAAVAALPIAGILARVAKLERCSVGVCEDSPNNFSNLLNDALGLASFIGVGAFLAQVINDPAAAEQAYAGAIQGVYTAGQSALDDLLSL